MASPERISISAHLYVNIYGRQLDAPALCLFHGGGWVGGSPEMLDGFATEISSKDITVMAPSYRTLKAHGTTVKDAIEDAHSVCIWLEKWRSSKVFLGGASAGGLLAIHAFRRMPGRFSGLVLLNPVTDTAKGGFTNRQIPAVGDESVSPHSFAATLPKVPTLIVHSQRDNVIPIAQSERFLETWNNADARLLRWQNGPHGFFNLPINRGAVAAEVASFVQKWQTGK